jgi:hypothetical protein
MELIPTLLKLFHEIAMEGTLSNSFYDASILLIPKQHKKTTNNGITSQYTNIDAKLSINYWQMEFNSISKRSYTMIKSVSSQEWFIIHKSLNVIQHIKRSKTEKTTQSPQ